MSASAPEELAQDQARDEKMPHYFCHRCLPAMGESGKAVCGTLAKRRGIVGAQPGACWVCTDLWDQGYTCAECGYHNWHGAK